MNTTEWYEAVKPLVNGLNFFVSDLENIKEETKSSDTHMVRVKVTKEGYIVGPIGDRVPKMKEVAFDRRMPISQSNLDSTVDRILGLLSDPTGQNGEALGDRLVEAEGYLRYVKHTIETWSSGCPFEALDLTGIEITAYTPVGAEPYYDHLKSAINKTPDQIRELVLKLKQAIETDYIQWFATRDKEEKVVKVESVL